MPKSSIAQGPQHGTLKGHMTRVHKCVLKLVNLFVQNLQKLNMIDLGIISPLICDALWSICHKGGLWAPLQNCFVVLRTHVFIHECNLSWVCAAPWLLLVVMMILVVESAVHLARLGDIKNAVESVT